MAVMYKCRQKVTKPVESMTMTVRLDLTNSDPETWAEYYDDAVGLEAEDDAFDTFFGHYPCVLEDGVELGKLNRNNFSRYTNGSSAPITTVGKDVMICFPKRGYKIWKTGNYLFVSITAKPNPDSSYGYYAFSYNGTVHDKIYISAYSMNAGDGTVAYATSGVGYGNYTSTQARNACANKGEGYDTFNYYALTYLQCMYLIKYKGLSSTYTFGTGSTYTKDVHGALDSNGMDVDTSINACAKLFGIYNLWSCGVSPTCIDGIRTDNSGYPCVADGNYNDSGTGYTRVGSNTPVFPSSTNIGGLGLRAVQGTTQSGFFPYMSEQNINSDRRYGYLGCLYGVGKNALMYLGTLSRADDGGLFNYSVTATLGLSGRFYFVYYA